MCTVTFIPLERGYCITSNRDEKYSRAKAIYPSAYVHNDCQLIYPKDAMAGGTWIALKDNGDAAVLLNGAFIRHTPLPRYRKSRGLLLLEVLAAKDPALAISMKNLFGIESFTLILFEGGALYEYRWDETELYYKHLDVNRPHIWSSVTLYDGLVIKKRKQWFEEFVRSTANPTEQQIVTFHRYAGDGDSNNDLVMERDGVYSTMSITSIQLNSGHGVMNYYDVADNEWHTE